MLAVSIYYKASPAGLFLLLLSNMSQPPGTGTGMLMALTKYHQCMTNLEMAYLCKRQGKLFQGLGESIGCLHVVQESPLVLYLLRPFTAFPFGYSFALDLLVGSAHSQAWTAACLDSGYHGYSSPDLSIPVLLSILLGGFKFHITHGEQ